MVMPPMVLVFGGQGAAPSPMVMPPMVVLVIFADPHAAAAAQPGAAHNIAPMVTYPVFPNVPLVVYGAQQGAAAGAPPMVIMPMLVIFGGR
jgi:hypothetical protein